ncbi:MAG TPA: DUF1016 N-terminal domain-containing protein [Gammaproteobacteria bacterium]|nr:DUF1016 N-terminal domain-containing protein [Gammaproteobacteria bacterium]
MDKLLEKTEESLTLDPNYREFLSRVKARLKTAQIRAALASNSEQIQFYWELGGELIEKQKAHKWGESFLTQFSHDMRTANPGMQGFSKRNLEHMRRFATVYPRSEFAKQAVSQLPWGHIVRLMQLIKNEPERSWYAQQVIKNGWSRSVMEMQIESGLYERQGITSNKITNYHEHLPASQSDLARDIL